MPENKITFYFSTDFLRFLTGDEILDLRQTAEAQLLFEGPEKQTISWRGYKVPLSGSTTRNQDGSYVGGFSFGIMTCENSGTYHYSADHIFCFYRFESCRRFNAETRVKQKAEEIRRSAATVQRRKKSEINYIVGYIQRAKDGKCACHKEDCIYEAIRAAI